MRTQEDIDIFIALIESELENNKTNLTAEQKRRLIPLYTELKSESAKTKKKGFDKESIDTLIKLTSLIWQIIMGST